MQNEKIQVSLKRIMSIMIYFKNKMKNFMRHLFKLIKKENNLSIFSNDDETSNLLIEGKYKILRSGIQDKTKGKLKIIFHVFNKEKYIAKRFKKKHKEEREYYAKKLHNEFCLTSTFQHPNVLKAVDFFEYKNDWHIVTPYCKKGDLFNIIQNRNLEWERKEKYIKQLIDGMLYLHNTGIAHRDIKLENLVVDENDNLIITNFGSADVYKMVWEKEKRLCYEFKGTQPFIAPEIYSKREKGFDGEKADVWSCGIVVYAILFHFLPFKVSTIVSNTYTHFMEHRMDKTGIIYRLPLRLKDILFAMLEPDPNLRISFKNIQNSDWYKNLQIKLEN